MTNAGDISLRMLLDTSGFAGGINISVQMLGVFQTAQKAAFAPNGPKIDTSAYQAQINNLNTANQQFQASLVQTAQASQQNTSAINTNTAALNSSKTAVREAAGGFNLFGVSIKDAGLSLLGIQGGIGIIQQLKSGISDLINEASKLQAVNLGLQNVANFKGIPQEVIKSEINNLDIVKNGIISYGEAALSVSNLMRSGLNLEQSINLLKGFTDSAVFGRQASLELGYAVVSGTEGWRNYNNMLLDNMGMTTNIAVLNKRAGLSEEELANKVNDSTVATRQYEEVMKELALSQGNAEKYANTFAGKQSQVNTNLLKGKQSAGELIQGGYAPLLDKMNLLSETGSKVVGVFGAIEKSVPGPTEEVKKFMIEVGTANLVLPGLGMLNQAFDAIEGSIVSAGNSLEGFLRQFEFINDYLNNSVLARWLSGALGVDNLPKEGTAPMGPELPPGFKKTGRGGEMEGIDYAGKSTVSSKTKSKGKDSDWEYTTDIQDKEAKIKELQKLQEISPKGSMQFEIYQKQIDDLNSSIEFYKKQLSEIQKLPDNLQAGVLPSNDNTKEIAPIRSKSVPTQMERLWQNAKTKEEVQAEKDKIRERIDNFASGLTGLTSSLGLADTGLGKFAGTINDGLSVVDSFFKILNSFGAGGGGLGGFLSTIFGIGASFIPGGGAVAGAAGGGGGFGHSFGPGHSTLSKIISSYGGERVVQVPYIADFTGDGSKLRIVLKSAESAYKRMKGTK